MNFEQLIYTLKSQSEIILPGTKAQQKLAPVNRPFLNKFPKNARQAGVAVILFPDHNQQTNILLTLRASYRGTHSSQISFPGGKKEVSDLTLRATAIRETEEETNLKNLMYLHELTQIYIPPSNFNVSPYLFYCNNIQHIKKNIEVEQIISFPVEKLLSSATVSSFITQTSYAKNMKVPCYKVDNHYIWGATAMILSELKDVLKNYDSF